VFPHCLPPTADGGYAGISYCTLKLNGEAGEVAEEVGKALRDDGGQFTGERREKIKKEIGDVLWYLAMLSWLFQFDFNEIAEENLRKLAMRAQKGTIHGSGSDR
jgi:NTP pyrophosphatase (non-canonical NTP hydrolase)